MEARLSSDGAITLNSLQARHHIDWATCSATRLRLVWPLWQGTAAVFHLWRPTLRRSFWQPAASTRPRCCGGYPPTTRLLLVRLLCITGMLFHLWRFTPTAPLLAFSSGSGSVRMWLPFSYGVSATLEVHSHGVTSVAFHPTALCSFLQPAATPTP